MARFKFRLEPLLEARRREEREAQRALAACRAVVVEIELHIAVANTQIRESMDRVRAMHLSGKLDLVFVAAHRRFVAAMQRRGIVWAQKLAAAQGKVAEAQASLVEAAKRRKAIEKLRERQLQRWQIEQERKQALELDEISMRIAFENLQLQEQRKTRPTNTESTIRGSATSASAPLSPDRSGSAVASEASA
jgi:flagellar export protein FliJ